MVLGWWCNSVMPSLIGWVHTQNDPCWRVYPMKYLYSFIVVHLFVVIIQVLTLNRLNCFKDYKRYIHILNHILDLVWHEYMKLTLEQQYMLTVLHNQYHACWCSGHFRSQGISRHRLTPKDGTLRLKHQKSKYILTIYSWIKMYVLEWWTLYALTRVLFLLFISHIATREINTRVTHQGVHKSFIRWCKYYLISYTTKHQWRSKRKPSHVYVSGAADNCTMLYRT